MKNSTIDRVFSLCIRQSYEHTCQYPSCPHCGNISGGADDCSHYYGRRYLGGRWWPDNCIALCRQQHNYLDKHRALHVDFIRAHIGEERHDALVKRLQSNHPYTTAQKREIHEHYKAELKRLQGLRAQGVEGYIPLEPYSEE